MISSSYNHKHEDFMFKRKTDDSRRLEPTAPLVPLWHDIVAVAAWVVLLASAIFLVWALTL